MANQRILYSEEMVGYGHPTKADTLNRLFMIKHDEAGGHTDRAASGANTDITSLRTLAYDIQVYNLKPVVNASVNKLDIFTKSGGAAPDASNPIIVSIPDGNGFTNRTRNAAVASGTGQIVLADAANYWSKGSLDGEIKTAYLYAIWSTADGGIVFALNGYSGFTRVPASVTATDDDYMHLEGSSSYTPVITDYCVAVAKIRYQYDTADTPDHTIQATALDAPQVMWNPKSDYGKTLTMATTLTKASDYTEAAQIDGVIKQSVCFDFTGISTADDSVSPVHLQVFIKTGSAVYGDATAQANSRQSTDGGAGYFVSATVKKRVYLNAGDSFHLGISVVGGAGNRSIRGDDYAPGMTTLTFNRVD